MQPRDLGAGQLCITVTVSRYVLEVFGEFFLLPVPGPLVSSLERTGQAEIADLDCAILVDKDISRFQITMQYARRMYILNRAKQIINNRLDMLYLQMYSAFDNLLQITLGQFKHNIYRVKSLQILRFAQVEKPNDIGVVEATQELDLT